MRYLIVPALLLAFTVYCLIDVVRSRDDEIRGLPKTLWVFLVLFFPMAGGIGWLLAGRPPRTGPRTPRGPARPVRRTSGPDDDPDFLRSIDPPRRVPRPDPVPADDPPITTPPEDRTPSVEEPDRDDPRT